MNYNGKKILHFEDDRFIGGVFKVKFESAGFDFKLLAQTPEKSEDLIKLVLEEKPDLIIMGVILPIMDGYKATKIFKSNQQTKNIPIFGIDDLGLVEDINKARESGMTDYLVNAHYTPSEIVDIIKSFLAAPKKYRFGILPPKAKEMAVGGLASDNEGIAMVDMVLNQASLQAGTVKYDMKSFDFKSVVEEIVEDKRTPAEKKGLKMETDIKDGNYVISGDQHWLKEAILNLVDNAVKCTVTGKITVGLELKEKQVFFYVRDTGRGITDEDRKNLYTEGGRGKDSLKYNVDSTGYGLSTVKLVVEAHKGKVWEDTEVGKGSTGLGIFSSGFVGC